MKIKIFVASHKKAVFPEASCFIPMQVGAANTTERFEGMQPDDVGENISRKKPMYCELTAQYWAWKNEDADYYGLCHYRRYLNFSEEEYDEEPWGNIIEDSIDDDTVEKYGLTDEAVEKAVSGQDIVIYRALNVTKFPVPTQSVWDHYDKAPHLNIDDLDIMMNIIKEKYPDYFKTAEKYLSGKLGYFCSIFVMKKEIFQRYSEFLFDILSEFEKKADMRLYNIEGIRTPGHLAERLLGIFVLQEKIFNPSLKVKELQNVLFQHPERKACIITPYFDSQKTVPIVFSSSNEFAPVCAVVIESIIENSSQDNCYDIIILEKNISDKNKKIIKSLANGRPNFIIRFANVSYIVNKYKLQANQHISVETYYRFLIQSILPEYDKVLYFDSDIICRRDVADLFETEIGNNLLGAVIDADMNGQLKLPGSDFFQYLSTELKLEDPYSYFQAGVLIMNLNELRKVSSTDLWLRRAQKIYRYLDQDILNKYCQGHIYYLDMAWNTLIECNNYRVKVLINGARWEIYLAYQKARENPYIIHYAGFQKPWNMRDVDFEDDFWKYAKNTPYYEHLLCNLMRNSIPSSTNAPADVPVSNPTAAIIPVHRAPLTKRIRYEIVDDLAASKYLPQGSRRRSFAQKVFHWLFK